MTRKNNSIYDDPRALGEYLKRRGVDEGSKDPEKFTPSPEQLKSRLWSLRDYLDENIKPRLTLNTVEEITTALECLQKGRQLFDGDIKKNYQEVIEKMAPDSGQEEIIAAFKQTELELKFIERELKIKRDFIIFEKNKIKPITKKFNSDLNIEEINSLALELMEIKKLWQKKWNKYINFADHSEISEYKNTDSVRDLYRKIDDKMEEITKQLDEWVEKYDSAEEEKIATKKLTESVIKKFLNSPEKEIFFSSDFNLDEARKDWAEKHQEFMAAGKNWDEDKRAAFSRQAQSLLETLTAKLDEAKEYLGGAKNFKRYDSTRLAQTLIEQIKADLAQLGLAPTTENFPKLISETQQRFVSLLAQVEKKLAELKLTPPDGAAVRAEEIKKLYARLVNEEDITLPVLKENLTAADFEKIAEKFQNLKNDLDGLLNKTSEKIPTADELKTELETALTDSRIISTKSTTALAPNDLPFANSAEIATTTRTQIPAIKQNSIPNNKNLEQTIEQTITTLEIIKDETIMPEIKRTLERSATLKKIELSKEEIKSEAQILSKVVQTNTTNFQSSQIILETKLEEKSEAHKKIAKFLRRTIVVFIIVGTLGLLIDKYAPDKYRKKPIKPEEKPKEQFESGGPVQTTQPDLPEYVTPAEEIPTITLETPTPIIQPAAEPLLQPDTVAFNPNDYPYNPKAREIPVAGSSESEEFEEAMKKQASPPAPELKQPTSQPITNEGANFLPKK